jgi:hypothetical protein
MSEIVPQPDSWVFSRARNNQRPLHSNIDAINGPRVKSTAHKVKLDIPGDILIQSDSFNMNKANIVVVTLDPQIFLTRTHWKTQYFDSFSRSGLPSSDKVIGLLARCGIILIGADPHGHVARVWGDEKPFWKLFNNCYIGDFVFFISLTIEGIFYVLLSLLRLDKDLTLSGSSSHLIIIQPYMVGVVVVLADFLESGDGFEGALLHSPHFPVQVTWGAHLVIIFRVECEPFHLHAWSGLWEIIACDYSWKKILLVIFAIFTRRFNPAKDQGFHIWVAIRVWGY